MIIDLDQAAPDQFDPKGFQAQPFCIPLAARWEERDLTIEFLIFRQQQCHMILVRFKLCLPVHEHELHTHLFHSL